MGTPRQGILWLTVFAIAMAQVEAALVIHLRSIYYSEDPLTVFPLVLLSHRDLAIELARECATMIMILSVAFLHSRRGIRTFAAFLYAFGVWDIAYYGWLKIMLGWPTRWLEWDVLFLIPWPWLGPWIAPSLVAVLFVGWGAWLLATETAARLTRLAASALATGAALVLVAFLLPGLPLLAGAEAAGGFEPRDFRWSLFVPGYVLMAAGLSIAGSRRTLQP
jgi:hypothetical protein